MNGCRPRHWRVPSPARGCRQDRNGPRILPKSANLPWTREPDPARRHNAFYATPEVIAEFGIEGECLRPVMTMTR